MEAVPLPVVVERDHEEVLPSQFLQELRRASTRQDVVTQAARDPLEA